MSLEEKVGQMFLPRCPQKEAVSVVETYHLGGYILFDEVIRPYTKEQFTEHNEAFQAASMIPMLIAVDEEGGSVNRLSWYTNYRKEPFQSPQELYQKGGLDQIKLDTKEKDALLKSVGINVNLAPVADVSTNEQDFIYARSFGKDAEQTSAYVTQVVTQMKEDQMGSVLKHFPGYGNNKDTHTGSSLDERSYESFQQSDFLPFEAGSKAGAGGILVSHNIVTSIDQQTPASLSLPVHEILRNKLHFTGVILTDDLYMKAIRNEWSDEEAAIKAVQAGNDMLIIRHYDTQIPALIQAVKDGTISEARINESVIRILTWKRELGLL